MVMVKQVKKVNEPVVEDVWPMVTVVMDTVVGLLSLMHSVKMPIQAHVLLWMGPMMDPPLLPCALDLLIPVP